MAYLQDNAGYIFRIFNLIIIFVCYACMGGIQGVLAWTLAHTPCGACILPIGYSDPVDFLRSAFYRGMNIHEG